MGMGLNLNHLQHFRNAHLLLQLATCDPPGQVDIWRKGKEASLPYESSSSDYDGDCDKQKNALFLIPGAREYVRL